MKNLEENRNLFRDVIRLLIGIAIKHRKIMQHHLQETGIFQAQHRLLMQISRNQFASQKELAESMGVSTATIAVTLKKLERGGYINKIMNSQDNCLNQITITEKGHKVVEQSRKIFESIEKKLFEGVTEEELKSLFSIMKKIDANLNIIESNIESERGKD